jgi:hypothetical protein
LAQLGEIMKVYVASSWEDRHITREVAECLERLGVEVTEHWWTHTSQDNFMQYCESDIKGMQHAELLVFLNFNGKATGGKYVEFGMAVQRQIPILAFGRPITTVFRPKCIYFEQYNIDQLSNIAKCVYDYAQGLC